MKMEVLEEAFRLKRLIDIREVEIKTLDKLKESVVLKHNGLFLSDYQRPMPTIFEVDLETALNIIETMKRNSFKKIQGYEEELERL